MPPEIAHRRVRANGIAMHVAEAGGGPAVLLLHGFPELWYSWRCQLPALAAAGFRALAPDLRGYGDTAAPADVASYRMSTMVADVVALLDALHCERATIVGHDWGARIAWECAERYPERVAAVVALSVPWYPRPPAPPIATMRERSAGTFNFAVYFQEPGVAEAELEADVPASLRRFYHALSGDAPPELLPYLFTRKPADAGVLDGMPEPPRAPAWLTPADLDVYAAAFQRTGFGGALNRYRNMDADWEESARVPPRTIDQPALFLGGERDSAVVFGSLQPMQATLPNLRRTVLLPGCGHWVQQERAEAVNGELIGFLREEVGR